MNTPFEKAIENWQNGTLQVPKIFAEGGEINPLFWQLNVTAGKVWLMTKGISNREINVKFLREYYGFKGRTAADMWPQFKELYKKYLGVEVSERFK